MSGEIAKVPVDPTQFPEAAHKLARQALREHQRAERDAMNAVQHAVKSGQALVKAYDLCEYGQWEGFFELHFQQNEDQRLSPRTARTYMQLARNWSRLTAQHPQGFSSQRQAVKALAAIVQTDEPEPDAASLAARSQSAVAAPAARGASAGGKRRRTGPVWRASGTFVREALRLVNSLDAMMSDLVAHGYGLVQEAATVHSAASRLQTMLDKEIDEAEALQAAGQWTFVVERPVPARGGATAAKSRLKYRLAGETPTPPTESEAGHDE
ncbi:MAG TPA: hypothetical protein VNH11_15385 [Pirellulales bacterium]|nr:hypothetical protein [Pirellulales bacterium]